MKKKWILLCLVLPFFVSTLFARKHRLPARLDPGGSCEYVIVAPLSLAGPFERLADWKNSKGVRSRIVSLAYIKQNWPAGDTARSIREFLREAYRTWGVKWVLLGGDVTGLNGHELLPARMVQVKVLDYETMPADIYFSSLDGGWDGDHDGVYGEVADNIDLEPEVFVGRAPVRTPEEAAAFVDKVLKYEKAPTCDGLTKRILWIGANSDQQTTGKDMIDVHLSEARFPPGIRHKILTTVDNNLSTESLIQSIYEFRPHFLHAEAHGMPDRLYLDGSSFTNNDADELTNDFPFIYVSTACLTNRFDDDSLTEHLLRNPSGGAVACWACSRFGWYTPGNPGWGQSELVVREFWDLLYRDHRGRQPSMGELIHRARRRFIDRAQIDGTFRWLTYGMNLLGDPELPLWTGEPQVVSITVEADEDFESNGLRVVVRRRLGPAAGVRVGLWRQDSNGACRITVSGCNVVPTTHELNLPIDHEGEMFAVSETSDEGVAILVPDQDKGSASLQVRDLLVLTKSLALLKKRLGKLKHDRKLLERMMRDYEYLSRRVDERRRNLGAFFKEAARAEKWDVAERALDTVGRTLQGPSGDAMALKFVLDALGKTLRFNFFALKDENSPQGRIFRKLLALKKQVGENPANHPEKNESGVVEVFSNPGGAAVLLDGVPTGKTTPCKFAVSAGKHTVKVIMTGETIESDKIIVRAGRRYRRHFMLKSIRSFRGRVVLAGAKSNEGAVVTLYEKIRGDGNGEDVYVEIARQATDENGYFNFKRLPPKRLKAKASADGYSSAEKILRLNDDLQDQHPTMKATLKKLIDIQNSFWGELDSDDESGDW